MSIALADLVTRLQGEVPAQDSTPSATQYNDAVKDAVHAYNGRIGRRKYAEIAVTSGTAVYALPADFMKVIELISVGAAVAGGVLINHTGIIPVSSTWTEEHTIAGRSITFIPTPAYTLSRYLWYKAGHVLSGTSPDEEYADMLDYEVSVIMLKAQAIAWRLVGTKASRTKGWKYQIGDVMIDKSNVGKQLSGWMSDFDTEFDRRINHLIGTVGMMG